MELKLNVKFNIGDLVWIENPDWHWNKERYPREIKVMVTGYVIHHNAKSTKIYYTVAEANYEGEYTRSIRATGHSKRYCAKDLRKVEQ